MRTELLAILVAAAAAAPALAHHTGPAGSYVVGTYLSLLGEQVNVGLCQQPEGPFAFGVGGTCYLTPPSWPSTTRVTITVQDAVLGAWPFHWEAFNNHPVTCGLAGDGVGSVTVDIPTFCSHVLVRVGAGSLMGTITLS
jgi:hypothetical protein